MTGQEEVSARRNFVRQFSVMLPNRVGAFSTLAQMLRGYQIEVIGLSVQDSRDATVARLILDDPDRAEDFFSEQGMAYTVSELVVIKLRECGQELNKCLQVLYDAETNLDYAFSLMVQHQGYSLLAMYLEDAEFGALVLNRAGLTVVYENELCR